MLVVWQMKGVMVARIDKVTQRGDKLEDLGERAGEGSVRGGEGEGGGGGGNKRGRLREMYFLLVKYNQANQMEKKLSLVWTA